MEKSKKNSRGFGIIIGVLVVGLFAFLVYDKGLFNNKKEKEVFVSETTKKELSSKINWLSVKTDFTYHYPAVEDSIRMSITEFNTNVYGRNLTEDEKMVIVLESLQSEFQPLSISYEDVKGNFLKFYSKDYDYCHDMGDHCTQLPISLVEERYVSLFGTSPTHQDVESGGIFVDTTNQLYYIIGSTGGLSTSGRYYLYKNKYTEENDYAYVYVNIGTSGYSNHSQFLYNGLVVYGDDLSDIIYNEDVTIYKQDLTENEVEQFQIDATNYKSFQEYKFTFKKNRNGEYSFVGVEKVR